MKKALMFIVVAAVACTIAGCGSLRTPTSGPRNKTVWYQTFFGLSIESLAYGDGFIVGQK